MLELALAWLAMSAGSSCHVSPWAVLIPHLEMMSDTLLGLDTVTTALSLRPRPVLSS